MAATTPATPASARAWPRWWLPILAGVLALAFLGLRGLYDPDEGRYTNVALNMLASGDWINPHRNGEVGHWTKPPMTYWAIASSIRVFGVNAFAARLPAALAYLLCVALVFRIGKRLVQDGALPAVMFATMLLPFVASQLITTDCMLAACETLAVAAYVEWQFGARRDWRWLLLMWVALAAAMLTKGPPGLLPLLVMIAHNVLVGERRKHVMFNVIGIAVFVVLALPWYLTVVLNNPGLLDYFIGDEVVKRVTTDTFNRNGQWYGWLVVYLPTLLLGSLPWTWAWVRGLRAWPARFRAWRAGVGARRRDSRVLLLVLWLSLPLVVFCLSRSRLPLYILPLFVPLALLAAHGRLQRGQGMPRLSWVLAWSGLLIAFKLYGARHPSESNAQAWATALQARNGGPVHKVLFVEDTIRYGLHLYLGTDATIERISRDTLQNQPRFNPPYDEALATEVAESAGRRDAVWVCKQGDFADLAQRIAASDGQVSVLGPPLHGRVVFRVTRAPAMH